MRGLRDIASECAYTAVSTAMVIAYYVSSPRETNIAGKKAWRTIYRKLFPWRVLPRRPEDLVLLHVAGPGDARAAHAFLEALGNLEPGIQVLVCCGTLGSYNYLASANVQPAVRVEWIPFDLPRVMRNFLDHLRPRLYVDAQAGFWPNLVRELHRARIPSVFLRVDTVDWDRQREFPKWIRPIYERMLAMVGQFSVRAPVHRARLIELNVPPDRIVVGQNYRLKAAPAPRPDAADHYRQAFGLNPERRLIVLANPRDDEVLPIVGALREAAWASTLCILIACGSLDKCHRARKKMARRGWHSALMSRAGEVLKRAGIVLLDTQGELFDIYSVASVAIMGDTFPPTFSIGANPWEPLVQGCPISYGPELPQVEPLDALEHAGVARLAGDFRQVAQIVWAYLADPPRTTVVAGAARAAAANAPSAAQFDARLVSQALALEAEQRAGAGRPFMAIGRKPVFLP